MDNLRLEHLSADAHLLPFTPPSIEFSGRPSTSTTAQQSSTPFSAASWASLLAAEPLYPHTSTKHGLPSPDRSVCAWDVAPLHQKHGHPIDIAGFPHSAASSLRGEAPALQLKQGRYLSASKFGHLSAPLDSVSPCNLSGDNAVSDFRKDDLHLAGLLVAVETGDASPLASGVHPAAAHACKASFAWHGRHDSDSAFKENGAAEKAEVMGEHSLGLIESFKGGHYKACGGKGVMVKNEHEAGVTIASLEDGSIGLRLGKRMYYGDGGEEGNKRANSSSTCCNKNSGNVSCAATTAAANATSNIISVSTASANGANTSLVTPMAATAKSSGSIPSKKQRGSSSSAAVPMCQAEGCTADLSGAKEYHRRHKVCECHSKASKAIVNNLEQRFCQQCSRFHILSAFDEGKRSCRRRLAGHNERRRKPPPEPLPFLSSGGFPYFADCRVNAALHEHPYFFQQGGSSLVPASVDNAVLACQLGLAGFTQKESIGNYHALELHRLMQGLPPGGGPGVGVLDGGGTLMLTNGNHLALSTAPSMSPPASSSSVGILPHVSSEMAMSGRALSLLSTSLGSPETMSISLGMTTPSIDQIFSDTRALTASRQQVAPKSTCFSPGVGIASALRGLPLSHNRALNSLTSSSSGCSTELDQGEPPMSNFEGRSLFLMHSENSFQTLREGETSHHGRPVLDLMQISPGSSHHHHQQSQPDLPYVDLPGLSIFKTQNIM